MCVNSLATPNGVGSCDCPTSSSLQGSDCVCNEGFYDASISECYACHSDCKSCVDADHCTECLMENASPNTISAGCSCPYGTSQVNGKCQCPEGSYFASGVCINCSSKCVTCSDLNFCLTCSGTQVTNSQGNCIDECPVGYYPLVECEKCGNLCEKCNSSACETCVSNAQSLGWLSLIHI